MILESKDNVLGYDEITNNQICEYVYKVIGERDGFIYGQIKVEKDKVFLMQPYNVKGESTRIFADENTLIAFNKVKLSAKKGDYVRGRLIIKGQGKDRFLYLDNIEVMLNQKEFRKELKEALNKRWKEEGFSVSLGDFAMFDGNIEFSSWLSDKVELVLEEKYEAFMDEKIRKKQEQLEELKDRISKLEMREKPLREIEERVNSYIERNIISIPNNNYLSFNEYEYITFDKLIEDVWEYLYVVDGLYYQKDVIRMFLSSLRTKQLTLLWGRPGSGKTTLPMKIAEAIGAKLTRIQVQSNWTDNQDLLGFYNVVDKRYVSTPFLDAIIEAINNPKQLYFILLDEMNLSCIEYYFSEMLNVFTWDTEYRISLYSERIRSQIEEDLQNVTDELTKTQLESQLRGLEVYTPSLKIPSNVRFIGTLNIDATTKTISPKVMDRSYFIELQSEIPESHSNLGNMYNGQLDGKSVVVSADLFNVKKNSEITQIENTLNGIKQLGIPVSNRTITYIKQWYGYGDSEVNIDDIILGKVLVPIDFGIEEGLDIISRLKKILVGNTNTLDKIRRMEEKSVKTGRITYLED